jgi:hypothetical protein
VKSGFDRHLGAVLSGHPDATGYLCEPDPHRLFHRSMDCLVEEGRLDRLMARAERKLAFLQKQRAQNFTAADGLLQDFQALLAAGEPPAEDETPPAVPETHGAAPATASRDRAIAKRHKRETPRPERRNSESWRPAKPPVSAPGGLLSSAQSA